MKHYSSSLWGGRPVYTDVWSCYLDLPVRKWCCRLLIHVSTGTISAKFL